jgi:hypothetical protein
VVVRLCDVSKDCSVSPSSESLSIGLLEDCSVSPCASPCNQGTWQRCHQFECRSDLPQQQATTPH